MSFAFVPIFEGNTRVPYPVFKASDDKLVSPYEWADVSYRVQSDVDGKRVFVGLRTFEGSGPIAMVVRPWDWEANNRPAQPASADVIETVNLATAGLRGKRTTLGALLAWSSRSGFHHQRVIDAVFNRRWIRVAIQHLVDEWESGKRLVVRTVEHGGAHALVIKTPTSSVIVASLATGKEEPGDDPMIFDAEDGDANG